MPFYIDKSHPLFTFSPEISLGTCETLKKFKLNYFQYLRCYKDGSFTLLVNRTDMADEFFANDYPILSHVEETLKDRDTYSFLWDETLPEEPVKLARDKFGMHNGLTFIKRHEEYYDMIGFAMQKDLPNKLTHYMTYSNILDAFAADFLKDNQALFQHMDAHRILPPDHMRDPNRETLILKEKPLEIQGRYGLVTLSIQEVRCLELLREGMIYKQIANSLDISPRTVETYINRIRLKTGAHTRQQLIGLLPRP